MLSLENIRTRLREVLPRLIARYEVARLGIFGSYVRGEQRPDSDIDLLVDFREPIDLFAFVELEHELSDLLGVKVDLVMDSALKPNIGRRIRSEVVAV